MNHNCLTDDLLLTQYFEGACSDAESHQITQHLAICSGCQTHFAQLASLLADIDETQVERTHVPNQLVQRAMTLFDTANKKSTLIELAIGMLNGILTPLNSTHTPLPAGALRGSALETEDLTYHLTLGQLSLAIELNSAHSQQIDLCVRPLQPMSAGWTIRLNEGDVTRRLSSFDNDGIQVDALDHGDYIVTLEHQHEKEHQFHLRLVSQDD